MKLSRNEEDLFVENCPTEKGGKIDYLKVSKMIMKGEKSKKRRRHISKPTKMGQVDNSTKQFVFGRIADELWIDNYEVAILYEDFNAA